MCKNDNSFLEIYKTYVHDAIQIASRRHLTNALMFTAASALLGLIIPNFGDGDISSLCLSACGLLFCSIWSGILSSYYNLSHAKFYVVNDMEKQLSYAPYTEEWKILKERKYIPMTNIEKRAPCYFGILFIATFLFFIGSIIFKNFALLKQIFTIY